MTHSSRKLASRLCAFAAAALCAPALAAVGTDDLPDIGAPWDSSLSLSEEYQIGRAIVHRLREAGELLDDPELTDYIQSLGTGCPRTRRTATSASTSSWCATPRSTRSRCRAASSASTRA